MVSDVWIEAAALAGLAAGAAGCFAAWLNWRQLSYTEEQLAAERAKVETLGKVVAALAGMVETQKQQLIALLTQNQIAAAELALRQQELALAQAKLEWDQTGPLEKAGRWIDRWWKRATGR